MPFFLVVSFLKILFVCFPLICLIFLFHALHYFLHSSPAPSLALPLSTYSAYSSVLFPSLLILTLLLSSHLYPLLSFLSLFFPSPSFPSLSFLSPTWLQRPSWSGLSILLLFTHDNGQKIATLLNKLPCRPGPFKVPDSGSLTPSVCSFLCLASLTHTLLSLLI